MNPIDIIREFLCERNFDVRVEHKRSCGCGAFILEHKLAGGSYIEIGYDFKPCSISGIETEIWLRTNYYTRYDLIHPDMLDHVELDIREAIEIYEP